MKSLASSLALVLYALPAHSTSGYPTPAAWDAFKKTISGRLTGVVPSAKYCASLPGGCTDAQWGSALFRSTIPGATDQFNWEQGYDLKPPSLCLRNSTTCGQGNVPLYSVEAETSADIQAAVTFSSAHNLRLVIKSTGHDYLGRSTASNSLLVRTSNFKKISFSDSFFIGSENMGSVVTIGSGVYSHTLYEKGEAAGKIAVGGAAATVANAGGYVQGAGHSALSPTFGLGADNVLGEFHPDPENLSDTGLEFHIVIASGELLQVNSISHPDLFYALRGGGAGSWGIIPDHPGRREPHVLSSITTVHAQHIFDWDSVHAGQYFWAVTNGTGSDAFSAFALNTYMPDTTPEQSLALLSPFLNASLALLSQNFTYGDINDALFHPNDGAGFNTVLGSRLIPAATYRHSPGAVGKAYQKLLAGGATQILGHLVAGGKVAENANISSAVHPAWRTAKTHLVVSSSWDDSASLAEIREIRNFFQTTQVPILEEITGPHAAAYSNEADLLEPNFQTTFFGPNYAKLSFIKKKYDPNDLFIVGAGVGSERWDEWGLCQV
ncbi:FAD-binding domain-containing protein [Mycena latifolia]|nr:FAD-binding domain-containing protein [Mycena latifolia]